MVVDFHTHIFPEKVAKGAIEKLEGLANGKACTDGTYGGLRESMKEAGVDYSVILPVLTKPDQFKSVNQFAASHIGTEGIIPFGGIHPHAENYRGELDQIKEWGLKGIKLHPVYQNTFISDKRYLDIIRYALQLDLWVVIHAGIDIGYPTEVRAIPDVVLEMFERLPLRKGDNKIILAHMGGFDVWDGVEALLVGSDVYFDMSYSLGFMKEEQFVAIVRNHGANRIVFGTDSPWASQKEVLRMFRELPLSQEEKDMILYKNAANMLL